MKFKQFKMQFNLGLKRVNAKLNQKTFYDFDHAAFHQKMPAIDNIRLNNSKQKANETDSRRGSKRN